MLLFLDQDTKFTLATLNFINTTLVELKNDFNLYAAIQFSNKILSSDVVERKCKLEQKNLLISSGSLFNLKNLKKINWHNPNYFVDGVDYEFCLRANFSGYLLGECSNTPGFDHVTGQADKSYHIFKRKLFLRVYNSYRIRDILNAYIKLFVLSIIYCKFYYTLIFIKSFMIFSFYQILVRILNLFKLNEHNK
jgi:rhamnosyltransferase